MRITDTDIREKILNYKLSDLIEIDCEYCQQSFLRNKAGIQKALLKNNNQIFCGMDCFYKSKNTSVKTVCSHCNSEIVKSRSDFNKTANHFCNHSCSASFNNKLAFKKCLTPNCNNGVNPGKEYCSLQCFQNHKWIIRKSEIEINSNKFDFRAIRKYLLEVRGHKCEDCQNTEWKNQKIPLEMDHIDGNHENNNLDNLRLLCPNCHATTPTYKAKNKGKGRASRRQRYKEGKSF